MAALAFVVVTCWGLGSPEVLVSSTPPPEEISIVSGPAIVVSLYMCVCTWVGFVGEGCVCGVGGVGGKKQDCFAEFEVCGASGSER